MPVIAVGHNEDYIIAKRGGTEGENYYLLKVIRNSIHGDAEKAIIGLLEKEEFDSKLKELGINSLQFDKEYKEKCYKLVPAGILPPAGLNYSQRLHFFFLKLKNF